MTIGEKALAYVTDEAVVGLGTGRAATSFIEALGERVRSGLRVRGVATSQASAELARRLGIPLLTLEDLFAPAGATHPIDVTVDGADEVDPALDLIKGYGGALVREKIVAAASRHLVILVGKEKLVPVLGSRGKLPVEVVPFGLGLCGARLRELGCPGEVRRDEQGAAFVTDNLNLILDCRIGPLARPAEFEREILAVPGVVGTGLFVGLARTVLVQDGERVEIREREG